MQTSTSAREISFQSDVAWLDENGEKLQTAFPPMWTGSESAVKVEISENEA